MEGGERTHGARGCSNSSDQPPSLLTSACRAADPSCETRGAIRALPIQPGPRFTIVKS